MPKSRIYLAYGSNLNIWQMAERCPTAKMLGTAELKGYELLFRGKPHRAVATIEPKEGASVPVLLWKLRPTDEISLDRFEGVPNTYAKRMVEVAYGKESIKAMTYVMTLGFHAGLPSAEYLSRIAAGYDRAGFDFGVLTAALERSKEAMRQELAALERQYGARELTARAWGGLLNAAAQTQRDGITSDVRDTLDEESRLYLSSLFDVSRKTNHGPEYEDNIAFLEEVTANHPGGVESLDEEQLGYLLSLYTEHQFGELEWDELENQCREYLAGLDEPDAGQGTLFGMKWGC